MSKRKPKFPKNKFPGLHTLSSGVSLSEAFPGFASHYSPLHKQKLYTINVSGNMLVFIERMARDPVFRAKVDRLL